MLENTKIFETAENKELEQLIKDYQDLSAQAKDIKTSLEKVTERIKEMCNRQAGTYEIPNYVFKLDEQIRVSINVEKLAKVNKELLEEIPYSCFSVKNENLKKEKELWESIPSDAKKVTPVLVMGSIIRKTNI